MRLAYIQAGHTSTGMIRCVCFVLVHPSAPTLSASSISASARSRTSQVVLSGRSATKTLPGEPGTRSDSALWKGTSVLPSTTIEEGTCSL